MEQGCARGLQAAPQFQEGWRYAPSPAGLIPACTPQKRDVNATK